MTGVAGAEVPLEDTIGQLEAILTVLDAGDHALAAIHLNQAIELLRASAALETPQIQTECQPELRVAG